MQQQQFSASFPPSGRNGGLVGGPASFKVRTSSPGIPYSALVASEPRMPIGAAVAPAPRMPYGALVAPAPRMPYGAVVAGSYSDFADVSSGLFPFQYPPPNGSVRGAPAQMTPQQQYAFPPGPGEQPVAVQPQQQYVYAPAHMCQQTGFFMVPQMGQMLATPPQMGGPGLPTQTSPVFNVPSISQIGMQMQVPQNMGMDPQMVVPAVPVPTPSSSNTPKRRSKAIAIINPETGKNVMESEGQATEKTESTEIRSQEPTESDAFGASLTPAPEELEHKSSSADEVLKTRKKFAKKVDQLAVETEEHASAAKDIVVVDETATAKPRSDELQTTAILAEETPAVATISSSLVPEDSPSVAEPSTRPASTPPAVASESAFQGKKATSEDIESDSVSKVGEESIYHFPILKYREGQWSPQNPKGKKQYDRDFLMQMKKLSISLRKPELLDLDIFKDQGNQRQLKQTQRCGTDWMPEYAKPTLSRHANVPKRGSQSGGKKTDGARKIVVISGLSIQEKVELHSAENAWKPGKVMANGAEQDVILNLSKKARGILNKLTPQKFEVLLERFNDLVIDTEEKLRTCMELVFEKAVDEPEFSVAYARMCEVLQKKQVQNAETGQPINFRKLLIARCQQEFERDYMDGLDKIKYKQNMEEATTEERKKELRLEFEDKERRARRRSLGNIRFIGELYKLKMLTARIMHECVWKLLKALDEESLECLCRLLTTVGKDLEIETNAKIAEFRSREAASQQGFNHLDTYFKEMSAIINNKQTSSRVRFMLQDLIEVKLDNWRPRRDIAGPKTIDQIHKEVENEKSRQQLENLMNKPIRGGGPPGGSGGMGSDRDRDRDRGKRSSRGPVSGLGQLSNAQDPDGWTNVPSRPARPPTFTATYDPNRLQSMTGKMGKVDADSMQLGPGSKNTQFTAWGKGSAGTHLSQTKEDSQKNRFAALSLSMEQAPSSSTESDFSRRGASRSMGMPDSRGPSAAERQHAVQAVMNVMARGSLSSPAVKGAPAATVQATPPTGDASAKALLAEEVVQSQSKQLRGQADLSEDEVEKLAKPLLDEFIHNCDVKEAIACICEKFHSTTISIFVRTIINSFLERSVEARKNVGTLLHHLVKKQILLEEQYKQSFGFVLEEAGDLVIDIPKVWDYLGEIIAPSLEHGTVSLSVIAKLAETLQNEEYAGKLMVSVLHCLSTRLGHVKTGRIWSDSGVKWKQLIGKKDVKAFLEANKLEYTLEDVIESSRNGIKKSNWTPEAVASALLQHLRSEASNDEIFDWIDSNVGESARENWFIRILVETVAKSVISGPGSSMFELNKSQLTNRATLLKRYLENQPDRERQGLYALQHLMHRLEHPNKLLHKLFETLLEADVITDDAFEAWEKCDDPAEQEGKGVAIKSTTQFFTWLHETEEED